MKITCYSIYHSPNAYLGQQLAERELADLPVEVERRPLAIPKSRGTRVADLVGGREPARQSAYHRVDCSRFARRYGIPLNWPGPGVFEQRATRWRRSPFAREELPARAYYAAVGSGREEDLDRALFRAAWIEGEDVNEEPVLRRVALSVGLDPDALVSAALERGPGRALEASLAAFDDAGGPGVPTWVVDGELFWGKDRVQWMTDRLRVLLETSSWAGR